MDIEESVDRRVDLLVRTSCRPIVVLEERGNKHCSRQDIHSSIRLHSRGSARWM